MSVYKSESFVEFGNELDVRLFLMTLDVSEEFKPAVSYAVWKACSTEGKARRISNEHLELTVKAAVRALITYKARKPKGE